MFFLIFLIFLIWDSNILGHKIRFGLVWFRTQGSVWFWFEILICRVGSLQCCYWPVWVSRQIRAVQQCFGRLTSADGPKLAGSNWRVPPPYLFLGKLHYILILVKIGEYFVLVLFLAVFHIYQFSMWYQNLTKTLLEPQKKCINNYANILTSVLDPTVLVSVFACLFVIELFELAVYTGWGLL